MLKTNTQLEFEKTPPWSENLTEYDRAHFSLYMQLLSAAAENVSEAEMAYSIFDIDPSADADYALSTVRSHIERVKWLVQTGYTELFVNDLD